MIVNDAEESLAEQKDRGDELDEEDDVVIKTREETRMRQRLQLKLKAKVDEAKLKASRRKGPKVGAAPVGMETIAEGHIEDDLLTYRPAAKGSKETKVDPFDAFDPEGANDLLTDDQAQPARSAFKKRDSANAALKHADKVKKQVKMAKSKQLALALAARSEKMANIKNLLGKNIADKMTQKAREDAPAEE